jgi:N utilization substance protein A
MAKIKYAELVRALHLIEDNRQIDAEVVEEALKDAIAKAYRKHIGISDVEVRVEISKKGHIDAYHQYLVVEEVLDDELEISLEDAKKKDPKVELAGYIEEYIDITEFGRAAALQAKNVMKQKIREAEKVSVYNEYIDQLDDMVIGTIESVEEKFAVVNIGKTLALMPHSAQIPGEYYREGSRLRVIITEVNKETKGAQVLVSRASDYLVKRLFEKEVPEIYEGTVEIKAIAREAGDRCKMAVFSKDSNVDPIGACIGPRGVRVQAIIDEIKGEKIDIFEWSDNMGDLISNALSPAQVEAVFFSENMKNLVVAVDESQLSLAIGKKGKNARLAVKLTKRKIDIKTVQELEEAGIDISQKVFEFNVELEKEKREKASAHIKEMEQELQVESTNETSAIDLEVVVNEIDETKTVEEVIVEDTIVEETVVKEKVIEEKVIEEKVVEVEKEVVKAPVKKKKELKPRTGYVSKFEKIAGHSNRKQEPEPIPKKRKYKKDEEERRLRLKDLKKVENPTVKVEYSEEELEEIKRLADLQAQNTWIEEDVDFDEFSEYYDNVAK